MTREVGRTIPMVNISASFRRALWAAKMWDIHGGGGGGLLNNVRMGVICNIVVGFGRCARNRLLWDMMRGGRTGGRRKGTRQVTTGPNQ